MCKVEGCPRKVLAKGLCAMHYKRLWRGAELGDARPIRGGPRPLCSIDGCVLPRRCNGFCVKHNTRFKKYGDPLAIFATEQGTVPVEEIVFNGITFRRYPRAKQKCHRRYYKPGGSDILRGVQALHQEVWKHHNGPIPEGFVVHHKNGFDDNRIESLELQSEERHAKEHAEERRIYGKSNKQLKHLAEIRPLTKAWHASEAGLDWHRQHGKDTMAKRLKC